VQQLRDYKQNLGRQNGKYDACFHDNQGGKSEYEPGGCK
jgi:hypothetical protein